MTTCKVCGAPVPQPDRLYCSRACYIKSQKKLSQKTRDNLPDCANCGKKIELGNTRFCSRDCQKEYTLKQLPKCKHCGKPVNRPGNIYCSTECVAADKRNYRTCVTCGKRFAIAPSSNIANCSPACTVIYQKQQTMDAAREALPNYPHTQAGPEHHSAKLWIIQDPDGNTYEVTSLRDWVNYNSDLFPGSTKSQFYRGILRLKYTKVHFGKDYTYKGWSLLDWSDK